MMRAVILAGAFLIYNTPAVADEISAFHLRGECIEKAKSLFEKMDGKSNENCIETFFHGANYNTADNRCYLEISTSEDDIIHENIAYHTEYKYCKTRAIPNRRADGWSLYNKRMLLDVQTEEVIASACEGACMGGKMYDGWIKNSEKSGFSWLSMYSEYTQAGDFIDRKMK